ncbi:hydantoinase/oxoprolinase family protein [Acuticoccus sp. M5D2P5]|uniref:hydantoinase/oxoprolinase family protein n=1 Tax=Acuticoccus kalidii TaxID=2910977 RepID=UPI001F2DC323|nr:hydantoinase/oxoprolinase family protein [Acuticoccus kalidii]MCF3934707.1 hydantoinase/oxoprolinase family protein [Acuticoccus kalidii]
MTDVRIAVDIGGTFTDGVAVHVETNQIWVAKSLTTPDDPGEAVSTVVASLVGEMRAEVGDGAVSEVVHGTTLVTNALIERKGAPTAAIFTKGMRDILEIRRELRYDLYDLHFTLPDPLVARNMRFELDERMAADGTQIRPVDPAELEGLLDHIDASGAQVVAIGFLNAHANDAHERAVADFITARRPGLSVSSSAAVAPELREYERCTTVTANAYVKPLVYSYLNALERRLDDQAITAPLRIMLSSGGFTTSKLAAETPIQLLESGPAGGVLSALNAALTHDFQNILAFDMGGTTAKACVVTDGEPGIARSFEAGRVHRFKRGSGLPLLITSIDLIEIGAGGGSLAAMSALGTLSVGPASAGSVPGPACYGRGGIQATVTDADFWLGYLDGSSFLGGTMPLDRTAAETAIGSLADALGMSVDEAAFGIHDVVNENMASATRIHIAEKGYDPRDFTLVATGGAGPVHAVAIARKLGMPRVLCAPAAGAGSCLGFLAAPARIDKALVQTDELKAVPWTQIRAALDAMGEEAREELVSAGACAADLIFEVDVEMQYVGQGNSVSVKIPLDDVRAAYSGALFALFEEHYARLYGRSVPHGRPQVVAWRMIGREPIRHQRFLREADATHHGRAATRRLYDCERGAFVEAGVYRRDTLGAGTVLQGPLVIEEAESTFVVPFEATVRVLDDLSILAELF